MKFRIKYADQVVGLFILIALVAFCGIIVLLGGNQRWFAKNFKYRTSFESSSGVTVGTAITMRGFQVGKVDKVNLNAENRIDIDFHIFDKYQPKVTRNSLIELSVSPIGLGTSLLFHPGKSSESIPEGDYIPEMSSPEGQTIKEQELAEIPLKDDTITRLLANVNPILESVNTTLTEVNRALAGKSSGPAGRIINDLAATSSELPKTMANISSITDPANGKIASLLDQTDTLLRQVNATVANLEVLSSEIKDPTGLVPRLLDPQGSLKTLLDDKNAVYNRLVGMMDDIGKSIKNLSAIVSSLNGEMPKIASILEESRTTLQKTQDVLEGLKNNPLLSGGVPERKDQQSLFQSMREGEF